MKLSTLHLKGWFLLAAGILISGACTTGQAQSITGKWAKKAIKMVVIEKASGKRQDVSATGKQMVEMYKETIEFKPDHTFFMSIKTPYSTKAVEMYGTYKLSGSKLTMELDPKILEEWKKMGESLKKMSKANAAEAAKADDPRNKLPSSITVKSLTGSSMVWFYSGDAMMGDEKAKQYSMEQEVTYQKL